MIFEKVNPGHPDKVADRIAGAILDKANSLNDDFIAAVEVLIGHGKCLIINETNTHIEKCDIEDIVYRIVGSRLNNIEYIEVKQDVHLSENQDKVRKCGDNGIFKGAVVKEYEQFLTNIAGAIYEKKPFDGKYVIDTARKIITICQSNSTEEEIKDIVLPLIKDTEYKDYSLKINPLGYWSGGIGVDSGATNRKLGSDMGDAVSGGGLHGKDVSKADLTLNLFLHILAQGSRTGFFCSCSIGDDKVDVKMDDPWNIEQCGYFSGIAESMNDYIMKMGGFEKLAEWGLIQPEI